MMYTHDAVQTIIIVVTYFIGVLVGAFLTYLVYRKGVEV